MGGWEESKREGKKQNNLRYSRVEYITFSHLINSYVSICFCSSGGKCLSVEYTDMVGEIAKIHGLKLHIDGARIFNASVVSSMVHACAVLCNFISADHTICNRV